MMGLKNIVAAFLLFVNANLLAQTTDTLLSLQKAIELGIENSKLLKASTEKINIAKAKISEVYTQNLPSLKLSSNYTRISDNITPFSIKFPGAQEATVLNPQILNQFSENLGASQLIYAGGRVKKTLLSLDFLEKAAKLDYENDKSGVIYNIIYAYYSLYKLQQSKIILKANEELINARINDLRNLEQNGLILRNDVLKLELSLTQLNIQQLDINNSYETTRYGLNILIGLQDSAQYYLDSTNFFKYKLDKSYIEYESLALSARPDENATDKRVVASKLNIDVNKANYYPTISSTTNYNYLKPNQRVFPQRDKFDGTWNAGITFAWDISSLYNNKHYINEAKSTYNQYYQQKLALNENIKVELYTNYLAYKRSVEHLILSKQTLAQADENYRLINDRLQDKIVVAADLQDALTYLIQSQLNVLIDKAEIDLAYFKFIKSTGTLTK